MCLRAAYSFPERTGDDFQGGDGPGAVGAAVIELEFCAQATASARSIPSAFVSASSTLLALAVRALSSD